MNLHEKGPRDQRGPNETARAATSAISPQSIPAQADNPSRLEDGAWRFELAAMLPERVLAFWALDLRDTDPRANPRAYLWREITRLEIRRRKRAGGAL